MPPPPVVDVVAGAVLPPPVVVPAVVVVVPSPEEPPPAGVVVPLLEFVPAPVVLEPEFEPEVELAPEVVDVEVPDPVLVVIVWVSGVAVLVGGTVKDGAPVVSVVPAPLPPQAASASAAITAAPPARMARGRRLRTGNCI
jgi:hypothetical protein